MQARNLPTVLATLAISLLAACTPAPPSEAPRDAARLPALKIGLMPAVDIAPLVHARDAGLFQAAGLTVELEVYTNAQNRQAALQTGAIDGALTDLVALITNVHNGMDLRGTLSTDGVFPLLGRPDRDQSKAPAVGMMEISVSNWLVDQYLAPRTDHTRVFINEIPARLEALRSGQTDLGLFPEPLASVGARMGLEKISFPGIPTESLDILAFTAKAREHKMASLLVFHRVYAQAVEAVNTDPALARQALMSSIPNLPPDLGPEISLPVYQAPRLPSEAFVADLVTWTSRITGQNINLGAADILDERFIP